ncbi:MAG: DNA-directed RNA polymerase subunit omega [Firmicutes bacterium]|nr:DNA-directed RNA polymerase subunit omega [Bacillota bacterium]
MINPPLDELLSQVDSRYTLVVAAAKRARQMLETTSPDPEGRLLKPVSLALEEIRAGKLKYERSRGGLK